MSVLLTVLKVLGYTLLGLLALLAAAMFVRVTAHVDYSRSRLLVRVSALGRSYDVFDSSKPRKPQPKEESKEPSAEPKPEGALKDKIDRELLRTIIGAGKKSLTRVLRGMRVRHISIVLVAHGYDPYETGVKTGRAWAGLGALLALLRSVWYDLGVDRLDVIPDFMNVRKGEGSAAFEVSARPVTFLCAGGILGWYLLKYIIIKRLSARRQLSERTC